MSTLDSPLAGEVRRAMQWRADQLETTPDPQALIERGLREDRRHRRVVRTRVLAALLGLVLAVLLVDVLRPTPPAPDPAARVAAGPAASGALGTWAVRGSLSGSIATLAEATRRLSREDLTVDRLLYAGDVGPDRLVLALVDPPGRERRDPEDIAPAGDPADHPQRDVVALFGRAGAPVDSLAQDDPSRVLADATVLTWSHQQRSAAPLLVLAGSATRSARLSDEPVYDNGGGLTRTWRTVPLVNGVWAGRTGPKGPALARVQVGGFDGGVEVRGGTEPDPDDDVYDYASADYRLVSLVSDFARSHQVPAEGIDPHVLYDGGNGAGHVPRRRAAPAGRHRLPDRPGGGPLPRRDVVHDLSRPGATGGRRRRRPPPRGLRRGVGRRRRQLTGARGGAGCRAGADRRRGAAGLAALGDGRDQGQQRGLRHAGTCPVRWSGRRRAGRSRASTPTGTSSAAGRWWVSTTRTRWTSCPGDRDAPPVPAAVRRPAPDVRRREGCQATIPCGSMTNFLAAPLSKLW